MTVFITGASSGIGAGLAKEYAYKGFDLVLCGRRVDRLHEVSNECKMINQKCRIIEVQCDVTRKEEVDRAIETTLKQFGRIDILIANAGFGVTGQFEKLTVDDFRRQFETNVFGVLQTIYSSLDLLKASRGQIVILGSVYSYLSEPKKAPYCMSKFAVKALADSIHYELKPYGIGVTLICPGVVESEFRKIDNRGVFRSEFKEFAPSLLIMNTQKAVKQMICAIDHRQREVVITLHGKVAVFIQRHFPWLLGLLMNTLARFSNRRHN